MLVKQSAIHHAGRVLLCMLAIQSLLPAQIAVSWAEPMPYTLYWSALQIKIAPETGTGRWTGEAEASPELLLEALKREPRLYNGRGLERTIEFSLNGLRVRSDYDDPAVYAAIRPALDSLCARLDGFDRLEITGLGLPNGATAQLLVRLTAPPPAWLPAREVSFDARIFPAYEQPSTEGNAVHWGPYTDLLDREFITLSDFWNIVFQLPVRIDAAGREHTIDQIFLQVINPFEAPLVQFRDARTAGGYTVEDMRRVLESVGGRIAPGTVVRMHTELKPKRVIDSTQIEISNVDLLLVRIVADNDPRLALRRSERRDYSVQWGNFTPRIPLLYARTFRRDTTAIPADVHVRQTVFNLKKREILQMFGLAPRVYRDKELLGPLHFTVEYNGTFYESAIGRAPAALIARLEKELQPHDRFIIRPLEAGEAALTGVSWEFDVLPEDPKPPLHKH